MLRVALAVAVLAVFGADALAGGADAEGAGAVPWHLTARPWQPLNVPPTAALDAIEGVCRFTVRHQDRRGAIIDPLLKREHQYATPYFAYAVGALAAAGRAADLLPAGVSAMDHATGCFGKGRAGIPDEHGEFFIPALTGALDLYREHVPADKWQSWRQRLALPRAEVVRGGVNNWETYAMKGEWMRALAGLVDRAAAVAYIEEAWLNRQRDRIAATPGCLYHDRSSRPDSLSVEAVGRGNLLALVHLGYDGPSAAAIRDAAEAGTFTASLLQDPSGQVPANGRTDGHVWVDVGYMLIFDVMAERCQARGQTEWAGRFRRAAMLSQISIDRWRRIDGPWAGSYYVTKNRFDPALRVGYQNASQYSNYNGSLMFHLAEAYHARRTAIAERPAPTEIGGYVLATDAEFASVVANAGGMLIQANLRGDTAPANGNYWTPLGIVRFARPGWDTRLGPSDGAMTADGGASFAPTFRDSGSWVRIATSGDRYEGRWTTEFVHPLLVRCAVEYRPRNARHGPAFLNAFVITPDGVLSTLSKTTDDATPWGQTWPVLESDGTPLRAVYGSRAACTGYPGGTDSQHFLAIDPDATLWTADAAVRSTYGDLRPVRVTRPAGPCTTFIYPRGAGDPAADEVHRSFRVTPEGFESILGRVAGRLYIGRSAAGGEGQSLDTDADGRPDVTFSQVCRFIVQHRAGTVLAVEADRAVVARVAGREVALKPYVPIRFGPPAER